MCLTAHGSGIERAWALAFESRKQETHRNGLLTEPAHEPAWACGPVPPLGCVPDVGDQGKAERMVH